MYNKYIGARYTTKVYENSLDHSSAEWESGVAFEPLVLVTYNNSSYLSKKQVPANIGDPESNPDYWACTGYYNGQILNLQNQINDIDTILEIVNNDKDNGFSIVELADNLRYMTDYSDFSASLSGYGLQGCCHNPITGTYLLGFVNGVGNQTILEVAADLSTVLQSKSYVNKLGHLNDITYNSKTNKYVIAGYDSNRPTFNGVYIIDGTTLEFESEISLSPVAPTVEYVIGKIAYDADNDIYYAMSNQTLNKYDASFNLIESISVPISHVEHNSIVTMTAQPMQSIEFYRNKLYAVYSPLMNTYAYTALLVVYNLDGSIYSTYNLEQPAGYLEIQSICAVDDHLVIIGGGPFAFFTAKLYLQNLVASDTFKSPYQSAPNIDPTSMNDVRVCGCYHVVNSSTTDAPFTGDFNLYVLSGFLGLIQIAITTSSTTMFAYRRCNHQGSFGNWTYGNNYLGRNSSGRYYGNLSGFCTGPKCVVFIPFDTVQAGITASHVSITGVNLYTVTNGAANNYTLTDVSVNEIRIYDRGVQVAFVKIDSSDFTTSYEPVNCTGTIDYTIS